MTSRAKTIIAEAIVVFVLGGAAIYYQQEVRELRIQNGKLATQLGDATKAALTNRGSFFRTADAYKAAVEEADAARAALAECEAKTHADGRR